MISHVNKNSNMSPTAEEEFILISRFTSKVPGKDKFVPPELARYDPDAKNWYIRALDLRFEAEQILRWEVARTLVADGGSYVAFAGSPQPVIHVGRAWMGHSIENICPCPQEACKLVNLEKVAPNCGAHNTDSSVDHPWNHPDYEMKQWHSEQDCPQDY